MTVFSEWKSYNMSCERQWMDRLMQMLHMRMVNKVKYRTSVVEVAGRQVWGWAGAVCAACCLCNVTPRQPGRSLHLLWTQGARSVQVCQMKGRSVWVLPLELLPWTTPVKGEGVSLFLTPPPLSGCLSQSYYWMPEGFGCQDVCFHYFIKCINP